MTDREYVESKWKMAKCYTGTNAYCFGWTYIESIGVILVQTRDGEIDAWAKAAEFTRQREEDIRCLEREIECVYWAELSGRKHPNHMATFGWSEEDVFLSSRNLATWARIKHRLQRELDHLREGMK